MSLTSLWRTERLYVATGKTLKRKITNSVKQVGFNNVKNEQLL